MLNTCVFQKTLQHEFSLVKGYSRGIEVIVINYKQLLRIKPKMTENKH